MTTEMAKWIVEAITVPALILLLTAIRKTLANYGQRLGALETGVAVLLDRSRRGRRITIAAPVKTEDDDDQE